VGLRKGDSRRLDILWADGTVRHYAVRDLRLACPCAMCVEETSGREILDPKTIGEDIEPRVISSVGRYAITVQWSDGHSTGIYPFDRLRRLGLGLQ
jgi:ATP-binding protein involved in chromosome partitioning